MFIEHLRTELVFAVIGNASSNANACECWYSTWALARTSCWRFSGEKMLLSGMGFGSPAKTYDRLALSANSRQAHKIRILMVIEC